MNNTEQTQSLSQRRQAFLDETCAHFNLDNRAISMIEINNLPTCIYSHKVNGGCAIGRHLPQTLAEELDKEKESGVYCVFNRLPQNLQELGKEFLVQVQILHDTKSKWNKTGLSKKGKEFKKFIKEFYIDNIKD